MFWWGVVVALLVIVVISRLIAPPRMDIEDKGKEGEEKPLPQRSGGLLSWLGGTLGGSFTKEPEALKDEKVYKRTWETDILG